MRITVLLCLFVCMCSAHGLKILCLFPLIGYSHHYIGHSLVKDLARRGHNVTFVAAFEEKERIENLHTIVLTGFFEEWAEMIEKSNLFNMRRSAIATVVFLGVMGGYVVEETLSNEKIQQLLNSNETFDVVLMEQFASDGLQAIAHHFGAPSVLISTSGQSVSTNHIFGSPDIPSYMTNVFLEYPTHKSFFRRTLNTVVYCIQKLFDHLYHFPAQNAIVQKYFPNAPHIYDLIYNTSLILLNSYMAPLPHLPNMIQIGGFHVQPAKKLPDDLQTILDNAKNGVIYFSLGSGLKSKDLPATLREGILRTFSKLKQTILWKFEEDLPGKPANVEIRKWYPQQDILAHPNVKLFISHGGLLSTIESIYYGVPMFGIPVFGDQNTNMGTVAHEGFGVMIDYSSLTEENFSNALDELLNNAKYSKAAKHASRLMHDQETKPADRAAFWIEYVVRHKGAKHLRSAALELTWYQHASLDVILFLTVVTVISFMVFYKIITWLFCKKKLSKQKTN